MFTINLQIEAFSKPIDDIQYQYVGMYQRLYNDYEDPNFDSKEFIHKITSEFSLMDSYMYRSAKTEVCTAYAQQKTARSKDEKLKESLEDELVENETDLCYLIVSGSTILSHADYVKELEINKRNKFKISKKLAKVKKRLSKSYKQVFGSKALLKQIDKLNKSIHNALENNSVPTYKTNKKYKQKNKNILTVEEFVKIKQKLLAETKLKYTEKRNNHPIYFVGEANQSGNRKFNFNFENNTVELKLTHKNRTIIHLKIDKNQIDNLLEIQELAEQLKIPVTIRLSKTHLQISVDRAILCDNSLNKKSRRKEIKKLKDEIGDTKMTKELYAEIYKRYNDTYVTKLKDNKIVNRLSGYDTNPECFGFYIADFDNNGNIIKTIECGFYDFSALNTKLGLSSTDPKQIKQNNQRKHEITLALTDYFKKLKHYNVSGVVAENLDFKPSKTKKSKPKEANRKIHNLWYRDISTNVVNKQCVINNILLYKVNAAYSSFIGNTMNPHLYDPVAAAKEILRRGFPNNPFFPPISEIIKTTLIDRSKQKPEKMEKITWVSLFSIYVKQSYSRGRNALDLSSVTTQRLRGSLNLKTKLFLYK